MYMVKNVPRTLDKDEKEVKSVVVPWVLYQEDIKVEDPSPQHLASSSGYNHPNPH